MANEKLIIIDGNSLLNRAYYAIPPLNNHEGKNVNAVFGFVNILLKALSDYKPSHVAVAFDKKGKNFRHAIYDQYKATRKGMPDDLAQQMPILFDLLDKMQITRVSESGVEADDVIGTLAKRFSLPTVIFSGDRDLLQLVDDSTTVCLTKRGITDVEEVSINTIKDLYGMIPSQIVEFKALKGDPSDNIPGVAGVGDKTAMNLLEKYGTIENVYDNIAEIKGAVQTKLLTGKEMAFVSKILATIKTDVQIECTLDDVVFKPIPAGVKTEFEKLEFRSLFKKLAELSDGEQVVEDDEEKFDEVKISETSQLDELVNSLKDKTQLAFYFDDNLYISCDEKTQYAIEIAKDLFGGISIESAMESLSPLLKNNSQKIVYDSKNIRHKLKFYNGDINNVAYDISVMQYLVEYRSFKDFSQLKQAYDLKSITPALIKLSNILKQKLKENNVWELYEKIELPLAKLLFEMETEGFKIDVEMLEDLGERYKAEIADLTATAHVMAGEPFNVLSPKQLGHILFEKLGLPAQKKTKTGYSTDNEILEKIKDAHPIVPVVQAIRKISKLSGTYIEGFKPLVRKGDLIHTTFNQTLTATGRLSSSEPNLQNLPVRDEDGKDIRKMFIPTKDVLISADYSQIELRLLAHFSGDENLINAFNEGRDIHAMVAQEIFGIPAEMVTPSMRRMAKAVNFGIIYGISEYGLSQNIGITPGKAKEYIAKYFESYPKIKDYLHSSIDFAKQNGYVMTITGRRRQIPEIASGNFQLRSFGERAAMNAPLQGSAADIIKIAMINVDAELKKRNMQSKLILQIHDELVLDVVEREVDEIKDILQKQMSDCFNLKVKLEINVSGGKNLYEAK